MLVNTAVPDNFIDETLWVGANDSNICWIETGDTEYTDPDNGQSKRNYYWAENSKARGYEEHILDEPNYPDVGAYQTYSITLDNGAAFYDIVIGITPVGISRQPGNTIYSHVGLETTTPNSRIIGSVKFRNFLIYNGRAYLPWPNHAQSVDFPAWWRWNWPAAANGIPMFFLPFSE